ncbi:hypothetical protein SAMN05428995_105228 [Loktanella sp. DSM 29012]|nr:hypothetical protein SAMN05428995_105228 [Loktanella sp. DSM 29012]
MTGTLIFIAGTVVGVFAFAVFIAAIDKKDHTHD